MIILKSKFLVLTICILLLKPEFSHAQYSIDLTDVDLIVCNKEDCDIKLFRQKSKNEFTELYLDIEKNNESNLISIQIEYENNTKKLNEINADTSEILIFTKDLKKTHIHDLLNKQEEILENWAQEKGNKRVLKFLNKSISVIQELYFGEKALQGGFGVSIKREDDHVKKWRLAYAKYYLTIDLNFGNNKHIYLLKEGAYTDYLLLPLKEADYLISEDQGISKLASASKYKTSYLENFSQFEFEDFLFTQKSGNKYKLLNSFNQKVLKSEYDTIMYNQFFIIGKNKNQIDIYNSYYKKTPLNNIQSAYLYRSGLEVLNDTGAVYYDSELNKIDKFLRRYYTVCGTVNSTEFAIDYDKNVQLYSLTKTNGGLALNLHKKRKYYLKHLKQTDQVTFLNNSITYEWDDNDDYTGTHYAYPHLLKVTKWGKCGILEYTYHNDSMPSDTISKDWIKEVIYLPEHIEGKVVLPVINDSIVFKPDGLIYFYRKNKVGIFPRHKNVQYKSIKQLTHSFYQIYRQKQKAWLDIRTNKEYYEK